MFEGGAVAECEKSRCQYKSAGTGGAGPRLQQEDIVPYDKPLLDSGVFAPPQVAGGRDDDATADGTEALGWMVPLRGARGREGGEHGSGFKGLGWMVPLRGARGREGGKHGSGFREGLGWSFPQKSRRAQQRGGFNGLGGESLGLGPDVWVDPGGVTSTPPIFDPGTQTDSSDGGGFDWNLLETNITHNLANIVAAFKPGSRYTGSSYGGAIASAYPSGYTRDAYGNLVPTGSAAYAGAQAGTGVANLLNSVSTFVTQNPILVLGGAVALMLLYRQPPRRRNPGRRRAVRRRSRR